MLEGRTRLPGADGTQERVEILAFERGEPRRVDLVADVEARNSLAVRPWCARVPGANPRTCCRYVL